MEDENQRQLHPAKSIRCILNLGGSAITFKNEFETINKEKLETVSQQLRQAMMVSTNSCGKVLGMDWSIDLELRELLLSVDDFFYLPALDFTHFIVVHGGGSFAHFQASKSGVHKGGLNQPLVKAGFVATRISVMSLNQDIVRSLAREGAPSVGMAPFACGWVTCEKNVRRHLERLHLFNYSKR